LYCHLATATQTVTGTFILDFTATETTADFRAANVSTTITETTLVTAANFVDTTTGDFVGIELDDNTRQWTKILSIAGTTLTLVDAITSAAAINNSVFTFTSLIERPLRVESTRRSRLGDNTEVELIKWSRQQYFAQTNKASEGTPTAFYYTPSLTNGEIFIWQTASSVQQVLKFTFQRPIQDFDLVSNNPDFPTEWIQPLIWGLAAMIGHEYQVQLNKMQMIEARAAQLLDDALGFDEEVTSLNIQPDFND